MLKQPAVHPRAWPVPFKYVQQLTLHHWLTEDRSGVVLPCWEVQFHTAKGSISQPWLVDQVLQAALSIAISLSRRL